MNTYAFANISDIEELLLFYDTLINDGHIISVVNIKNMLKLPTDLSQKFLQYYFMQRKEQLIATYLIEGYNKKKNEHICAILSEKEISDVVDIENYVIKIYTVQSNKSKVHPSALWRQEMNELVRMYKTNSKKDEPFIPQFSDFLLNDLKLKKKNPPLEDLNHPKQTDKEENNENKTPIKIKKEKISDDEKQTKKIKQEQTNKNEKNNENTMKTETFIKTSNDKSIFQFAQLVQKKNKINNDKEISSDKIKREVLIPQNKSETCISLDENYDKTKTEIDENLTNTLNSIKNETKLTSNVQENTNENRTNEKPLNLFHSDSSSSEIMEDNVKTPEKNIENVHLNVEKEIIEIDILNKIEKPLKKMQRLQSVKETKMYFENGYLVTTENDSCIYVDDSSSPKKTISMENTILGSAPNKKRKSSQQTLLTSFFKKKK